MRVRWRWCLLSVCMLVGYERRPSRYAQSKRTAGGDGRRSESTARARGAARRGTARHSSESTARHGTARHVKARHGTARHGMTRHGTAEQGRPSTAHLAFVKRRWSGGMTARRNTASRIV